MDLKFEKNALSFDVSGAMNKINEAIDICVDELSLAFQEILIRQIRQNGNGSSLMKDEAVRHVKELSRKINGGVLELEVGVDDEIADERAKIRTVVVLFGNQAEGPLHEKPGVATWKKHVAYRSMPNPDKRNADTYLPGFDQFDVSGVIMDNAMGRELDIRIRDFLRAVGQATNSIDYSVYLK